MLQVRLQNVAGTHAKRYRYAYRTLKVRIQNVTGTHAERYMYAYRTLMVRMQNVTGTHEDMENAPHPVPNSEHCVRMIDMLEVNFKTSDGLQTSNKPQSS